MLLQCVMTNSSGQKTLLVSLPVVTSLKMHTNCEHARCLEAQDDPSVIVHDNGAVSAHKDGMTSATACTQAKTTAEEEEVMIFGNIAQHARCINSAKGLQEPNARSQSVGCCSRQREGFPKSKGG